MKTFSYELILMLSIETVFVKLLLYTKCYTRHNRTLQELLFSKELQMGQKAQNRIK